MVDGLAHGEHRGGEPREMERVAGVPRDRMASLESLGDEPEWKGLSEADGLEGIEAEEVVGRMIRWGSRADDGGREGGDEIRSREEDERWMGGWSSYRWS